MNAGFGFEILVYFINIVGPSSQMNTIRGDYGKAMQGDLDEYRLCHYGQQPSWD